MCWVDPGPLLPGGLPDEQLDGAAYWSSLWDQSWWACDQMAAKILIALKAWGVRFFSSFFLFWGEAQIIITKKKLWQGYIQMIARVSGRSSAKILETDFRFFVIGVLLYCYTCKNRAFWALYIKNDVTSKKKEILLSKIDWKVLFIIREKKNQSDCLCRKKVIMICSYPLKTKIYKKIPDPFRLQGNQYFRGHLTARLRTIVP